MDEESISTEVSETDFAAFDEDWESETTSAEEDASPAGAEDAGGTAGEVPAGGGEETEAGESAAAPTNQTESGGAGAGGDGQAETPAAEGGDKAEDQRFDLTYMHETRPYGSDEVRALAQQGLDYPRIRGKLDGLNRDIEDMGGMETVRGAVGVLRELAETGGMSLEQVIDSARAGIISRRDKVSMDVAVERAKNERLRRASEERESREQAERTRNEAENAKRNADIKAFVEAFPDVQAKDVPAEVWDAVRGGQSLVAAYALYDGRRARAETAKLRGELETERKNSENRQKAAPTSRSAGNAGQTTDAFDEGWAYNDL